MGNNSSLPANQAIYIAAKQGKARELETICKNVSPSSRPENLLEWQDEDGRTALIVAAAKNHRDCVDILLRYQANVQHMSRKKEGGTALHEAVYRQNDKRIIEALLNYGASPFVENVMRLTAMDFAIVRKDVHVLRRLEHCGYASQYMSVRCLRAFGLSKAWYPRWVSVIPRHPCPLVPNRMSRRLLFLYTNAQQYDPICKIYLDGSTVTRSIGDGRPLALLTLHQAHTEPRMLACRQDQAGRWVISFRSPDNDPTALDSFIKAVQIGRENPPIYSVEELDGSRALPMARHPSNIDPIQQPEAPYEASPFADPSMIYQTGQPHWPSFDGNAQFATVPSIQSESEQGKDKMVPRDNEDDFEDDEFNEEASAPPLPPEYDFRGQGPSEPVHPPTYEPLGQDSMTMDDEGLCLVCLENPRTCGFVHGTSIHVCVCESCCQALQKSGQNLCPLCRQPIQHTITNVFF